MTNYSLSTIIKNKIKRKVSGFEPVLNIKVGKRNYLFGIPFDLTFDSNGNSKVFFNVEPLSILFNHFNSLKGKCFSINGGYKEILEDKKIIENGRDLKIITSIINLKEKYLLENGFLKLKSEFKDLNFEINFNSDLGELPLAQTDVKEIKEKYKLLDLKNKSLNDLENTCVGLGLKKIKNGNKTFYITVLSRIGIAEKEKGSELTKKEKISIQKDVFEMMNSLFA